MGRQVGIWLVAGQAAAALACSTLVGGPGASAIPPATADAGGPTAPVVSTPAATAAPSPTATVNCEVNDLLTRLNAVPAYDEFVIGFELFQAATRQTFFPVWFVDPAIDPHATGNQIAENSRLAVVHAAALVHQMNSVEPCVSALAGIASPVVVDRNYNSWFSGQILASALPRDAIVSQAQLDEIGAKFVKAYLRDQTPASLAPAPAGSCSWPEAAAGMRRHFDPARQNIGAQIVIDESGVEIYAQWEGAGQQDQALVSLLNVTMEFRCLHPPADQMTIIVVDPEGTVRLAGLLSGEAIRSADIADDRTQLRVVYQR